MPIIQLHIQGMTHHDIAARREEFVSTAVGRRIALRAARLCEDGRTVEAYVGGECVGVVARLDRDLAVGALRTEEKGGVLRGRIVEARDYVLLAEIKVAELPQVEAPATTSTPATTQPSTAPAAYTPSAMPTAPSAPPSRA